MGHYATNSMSLLETADKDLQILFKIVVVKFDNIITSAHRTSERQFELFQQGRTLIGGVWIVTDQSKVVTTVDGITKLSKHNADPSEAVDAVPYPWNPNDTRRIHLFAGYVIGVAEMLKQEGQMLYSLRWGGDWDGDTEVEDEIFKDLCHFEIIKI